MICGITGKVGSGKSLLGLDMMLRHFAKGGCCATNIELDLDAVARWCWKRGHAFDPEQYRLLELKQEPSFHKQIPCAAVFNPAPHQKILVFIDEAHLFFPSAEYRKLATVFQEIAAFVTQSRKFGVDVFLITQAWDTLWNTLRKQAELLYECRDMRKVKLPMIGAALGGVFGLTYVIRDEKTGERLDGGSTRIAKDLVSCYSTQQVYDAGTEELRASMGTYETQRRPVGWLSRTFRSAPPTRRALVEAELELEATEEQLEESAA